MNAANILRNVELSSIQSLDSHESAPGFSYLGNLHYIARKASVLQICLLSDHLCHTLNWLVHKNPDALNTRYRIYFPYHMVCIWILVASKLWSWIFLRLLSFLFLPCCYPPASYFFFSSVARISFFPDVSHWKLHSLKEQQNFYFINKKDTRGKVSRMRWFI